MADTQVPRTSWITSVLCTALRVDLTLGVDVDSRFAQYTACAPGDSFGRNDVDEIPLLKGISSHTHQDVMRMNERSGNDNDVIMKRVLMVLKMGVSLVAYGLPTIEAEQKVEALCAKIGLNSPDLNFAERSLTARLVQATYVVKCSRAVDFDKLTSCVELTDLMYAAEQFSEAELDAAIWCLHDIQEQQSPYGWLIQLFNMELLNICAVIASYGGNWDDVKAVACIAPLTILCRSACKQWPDQLGNLELVLVGGMTGLMSAVVYRQLYILGTERCRITTWYLSVLITDLAGGAVIYGIYETMYASVLNGAPKVVGGVLTSMILAVCLNLGWQFTGRDTDPYGIDVETGMRVELHGAEASYVPFETCGENQRWGDSNQMDWRFAFGAINAVLVLNMCIAFNMRVRKMFWHCLVAYSCLFLYGYLSLGMEHENTLSNYVIVAIIMFTTGSLAAVLELCTGAPSCTSILPTVMILAPGSTAVRISLEDMQFSGKVADVVLQQGIWDNLVLYCASFAVGLFVSLEAFKIPLRKKRDVRAFVQERVSLGDKAPRVPMTPLNVQHPSKPKAPENMTAHQVEDTCLESTVVSI